LAVTRRAADGVAAEDALRTCATGSSAGTGESWAEVLERSPESLHKASTNETLAAKYIEVRHDKRRVVERSRAPSQ